MTPAVHRVCIVRDPADDLPPAGPVGWASEQLRDALHARGIGTELVEQISDTPSDSLCIAITGPTAPVARELLGAAGTRIPDVPEALGLIAGRSGGQQVVLATGSDVRGRVYAIMELADMVACATDPLQALRSQRTNVESPANPIRGVARLFVSEIEDKSWFYDRASWRSYLAMLVSHRFNRVHLALGMGVNFLRDITDAYLLFPYPFLVAVPGYHVRAVGLADEARERNLETLRFVSDQAAACGLHFQLGLWTHGYAWVDSPNATYVIEGLRPDNHAAYCRDAVRSLLEACPGIAGLTFRVHGESGVPENSHAFWKEVFRGAVECGRPVELDVHPKGVDRQMIDLALQTGLRVTLSPKYTAEHMGLPGHQVQIRPTERAPVGGDDAFMQSMMRKSFGALNYTRYGYADFLNEDRDYGVFYRIWPGTQRLLLWGDPALAAGFSRQGGFCDSLGVEVCEPLSFKGRCGSGRLGGRDAYADATLRPAQDDWDWEKYIYTYRLLGRLLYNPSADPAAWRRYLAHEFGAAAGPVEAALASASRVLPLFTSAHSPSADNLSYWPEMYTNMSIVHDSLRDPYPDTPTPRRFGTVSALDPGLFAAVDEFADEMLRGERSARYSPLQVAGWLDQLASAAREKLSEAQRLAPDADAPVFRRLAVDVAIQAQIGRFFASKLRAAVAYALFKRTDEASWLPEALRQYRAARSAWAEAAQHARVYQADITVGREPWQRGHWADRLAAIDADIAEMEAECDRMEASVHTAAETNATPLTSPDPAPPALDYAHVPPAGFEPGQPVVVELGLRSNIDGLSLSVQLKYRHVNQSEEYRVAAMNCRDGTYSARIPGDYTDSAYPLQYFFELRKDRGQAWLYPGLSEDFANQPYIVVRRHAER